MIRILFPLLMLASATTTYSQDSLINIYLKNGEIRKTSYVYFQNTRTMAKAYVAVDSKKGFRYTVDQVDYIEGIDQYNRARFLKPIKIQVVEVFGERTFKSERIDIFSVNVVGGGYTPYKYKHLNYSKDDSPVKKLKYKNLKLDLSDNATSAAYLKKGNGVTIAQWLLYGAGATLIIVGMSNENAELTAPLIAGIVMFSIPFYLIPVKHKNFVKALKNYK